MNNIFQEQLDNLKAELKTLETYQLKLKKWGEFTADYCDNVARNKIDRSFYVFQSEPKFNPEVLILGLNPQENGTKYSGQYENPKWGLVSNGKMTGEVLIQQNPWYKGGKYVDDKEWNILRNLNITINVHNDLSQLFDNMVYMNILYFNSKDFKEFKDSFKNDWKEVFDNCVALSSLLIYEIIKPKRIICLGINNCYKSFIGNSKDEVIIHQSMHKCTIEEICIYGITHPSARVKNSIRKYIGWNLYVEWFNKPLFNLLETKISIIIQILYEVAKKQGLELVFDKNNLKDKFGSFKFTHQNRSDFSFLFEFQSSMYSDLRYEAHRMRFLDRAIKCTPPYDNWFNLPDGFNQKDFRVYFDNVINNLIIKYRND